MQFDLQLAVGQAPTVRMGFSPSDLLNYQAPCGGSKPPPYGWALVHPLHVIHSSFGGGSEYCSVRSQHHDLHRTDGL